MERAEAKLCRSLRRIGIKHRRVAHPARAHFDRHRTSGKPVYRIHDFPDRRSAPGSQIED